MDNGSDGSAGCPVPHPLGAEEHLCCLGQLLAELREVGWEEVTVPCGPQGPTVLQCSWELFPGGIPSPLQHEGSQEEMHCLAGEPWRNFSTD